MTGPGEQLDLFGEQPYQQQLPFPHSPQAIETEQALESAESSLGPVIAGILLAAAVAEAAPDDDSSSLSGVLTTGALFATPVFAARAAARGLSGLTDVTIDRLLGIVQPIILRRLYAMREEAPTPLLFGGPDLAEQARAAAISAIGQAADAMERYSNTPRADSTEDIYTMFDDHRGSDTRTATQRRAEAFAARTARWLVREGVFRAQAAVARTFGYTHKRWLSERDERVRHEHELLDGKVVPIRQKFVTETGSLMYPGDVSAPPHLVINCRCSLEWLRRG